MDFEKYNILPKTIQTTTTFLISIDEYLKEQGFLMWQHHGTISHKWLTFKECGIAPLELLPYPEYK